MRIEETNYTVNNRQLVLRNPEEKDAEMLLEYLQITNQETRYLLREPGEITLTAEEERAYIRSQNESDNSLLMIGLLDGAHVGNCSLMGMRPLRYRHRATIAIALYEKYTGLGIGRIMLEKLILAAKDCGIEQLELEVVSGNERAISLYKKLGFEIFGTMPRNMKYRDGTYADVYWMMKQLCGGKYEKEPPDI